MMRFVSVALLAAFIVCANGLVDVTSMPRKHLAGPASEFPNYKLPTPLDAALVEDSIFIEMWMEAKKPGSAKFQKVVFATDLFVDSEVEFTLSILSPIAAQLEYSLLTPTGREVDLAEHEYKGHWPIGETTIPETTYRFIEPEIGTWKLKITSADKLSSSEVARFTNADKPQGHIILWNRSKTRIHTHLNTYNLRLNQQIGLITGITEDSQIIAGVRPNILKDVVVTAEMEVTMPDGTEVDVQLHDDGLHGDLEANDGIYGGSIDATEAGVYTASAILTGTNANGVAFMRSSQHLIPVVIDTISLSGTAAGDLKDKERLDIRLNVAPDQGPLPSNTLFRAYAEVWAKDSTGADIPVCWIGGMTPVEGLDATPYVTVELNLKWLSLVNAVGPITLKNVVLQETDGFIPVSEQTSVPVQTTKEVATYLTKLPFTATEITTEMKQGRRTRLASRNVTDDKSYLVLVHGYCAGDNPFAKNPEDFTNPIFFLDSSANRNNNEFAALVYNFAEQQGATKYSLIGHSQGGMVGLHLLAYFESGLDDVSGGARVQSIGTPYQGCSAAGSSASLGSAFGIGCGANQDLAVDGAKLWLTGVPQEFRSSVSFYTTSYELGKFFGDYCNMAINAILEWPNDGTSELQYTSLPGGNNMGNTEKQCHTTDMKYSAQYYDRSRNQVMNKNAAR